MKLPRIAIDNYQFTIVMVVLLLILGISSFLTMPRTEDPPLDFPGANVIIAYPGGNPQDLEELIADPLEEALNQLDDIKHIETTMRNGVVLTSIEFTFGTDPDEKFNQVVQKVNSVRSELPEELYNLEILKWSSSDVVIMQLALASEQASFASLEDDAERLKKKLEQVDGIMLVETLAAPDQEVRVSLDMEKMAAMNVSADGVEKAIMSNNANIPGGDIDIGRKDFGVRTSGSYAGLEEIRNTVVGSYNGRLVYLKDIAGVDFDYADRNYLARCDGERCIFMTVKQKAGYNIYSISKAVAPVLEETRASLGSGTRLVTLFDQTESVDHRVNGFLANLLQGIFLVGLLILLSLGFRASVIVILAIPFSILIGLGFTDLSGFGLQQISIAGLVISLGLLVDNGIVVVENVERFIGMGYSNREAAAQGTAQLGWPVITATLTTMLAFIPIIAMPDKAGRFIQSMPVTVIFTLLASLILALTLVPYLSSVFLKAHQGGSNAGYNNGQDSNPGDSTSDSNQSDSNQDSNPGDSTLGSNQSDSNQGGNLETGNLEDKRLRRWLSRIIEGPYRRTLNWSLHRIPLVLLLSVLGLAGAALLFRYIGVSFFPKAEKPQFMIRISTPEGSSLARTDQVARYVESVLDTMPAVKHYAANVGHGNPRIYYNIFPRQRDRSFAEVYVELREYNPDDFDNTITGLRRYFADYPGARIDIKEFEQGTPVEAPLTVKITGKDIGELRRIATDVEQYVREIPGAVNVNNQLSKVGTDLYFNINRDKAGMLGVPVAVIDKTVRMAVTGIPVSNYRDEEGKTYPIVLRMAEGAKLGPDDFEKIHVASVTGRAVPLRQLASVELQEGPGIIKHYDLDRTGTVTADIARGSSLDDVVAGLDAKLSEYPWPQGYEYFYTGELESREESFGGMMKASIIALIAIFAVLVLQFRSFTQPLIIFTSIPLAAIGSSLALWLTGNSFSFTAGIGLISLIGVVINNSIILVDYTNKLVEEGRDRTVAVMEAAETRFTPILLTTLTTAGGLLPLTLRGGTLWAPMGWTIIGGLLVSTVLTLIVVPVLYKLYK